MQQVTRKLLSISSLILIMLATPAWALSLDEAKSKGLLGETPSGYLASVNPNPDNDTRQLMKDINTKRKAAYMQSASKAGVSLNIIEIRIGQRLYEAAPKGTFLQNQNGLWIQK